MIANEWLRLRSTGSKSCAGPSLRIAVRVVVLAARQSVPVVFPRREFAVAGRRPDRLSLAFRPDFLLRAALPSGENRASFAYISEGRHSTLACAECDVSRLWLQDGAMSAKDFEILRQHMLVEISAGTFHVSDVIGKAALDERVMAAMGKVPRHEFVPVELQPYAYANLPPPIGFEKTISPPFIVALMTDLLDIGADDTVLEVGTGLGYQAAILAQLARNVYSIEIIEELARRAKQRLRQQGCTNIEL